jgi:hypothetical protein
MDQHLQGTWQQRQLLGTEVKRFIFDQKLLDPKGYNKKKIIEIKALIPQFSAVDDDLSFTAFQRAASEVILSNNLEAIKSCHSRAVPPIVSANLARATPKVTPFKDLEVKSCRAHVCVNPSTEKVPPSIMAASPFVPHLFTVVLTWANKYQNSRAHVLLAMPPGTQPGGMVYLFIMSS